MREGWRRSSRRVKMKIYFSRYKNEPSTTIDLTGSDEEHAEGFFPILQEWQYYVVVYDFRFGNIEIIDNIKRNGQNVELMYDGLPSKQFVGNTRGDGLHNVDRLHNVVQKRVVMKWQTTRNEVDNVVFAMRHMETYMEKNAQNGIVGWMWREINKRLRLESCEKKYVAKMLLSEHNFQRERVLAAAKEFDAKNRVPPTKKTST